MVVDAPWWLTMLQAAALCLLYATAAAGVHHAGGTRVLWVCWTLLVAALAGWGASRVGTENPFSRFSRLDPLLFFVIAVLILGTPTASATHALATLARNEPGTWLRPICGAALVGLLMLPIGLLMGVVVEILWPH